MPGFNVDNFTAQNCVLSTVERDLKTLQEQVVFNIAPASITENAALNVSPIQSINSNLPRYVINGTTGRTVTFKALLHSMSTNVVSRTGQTLNSNKTFDSRFAALGKNLITKAAVSLIPFASNVVRGIDTLSRLADIDVFKETFKIDEKYSALNVDSAINKLMNLLIPGLDEKVLKNTVKQIQINYPFFNGKRYYLTSVNVERKFFDNKLNTVFAEVEITMVQAGTNVGSGVF